MIIFEVKAQGRVSCILHPASSENLRPRNLKRDLAPRDFKLEHSTLIIFDPSFLAAFLMFSFSACFAFWSVVMDRMIRNELKT